MAEQNNTNLPALITRAQNQGGKKPNNVKTSTVDSNLISKHTTALNNLTEAIDKEKGLTKSITKLTNEISVLKDVILNASRLTERFAQGGGPRAGQAGPAYRPTPNDGRGAFEAGYGRRYEGRTVPKYRPTMMEQIKDFSPFEWATRGTIFEGPLARRREKAMFKQALGDRYKEGDYERTQKAAREFEKTRELERKLRSMGFTSKEVGGYEEEGFAGITKPSIQERRRRAGETLADVYGDFPGAASGTPMPGGPAPAGPTIETGPVPSSDAAKPFIATEKELEASKSRISLSTDIGDALQDKAKPLSMSEKELEAIKLQQEMVDILKEIRDCACEGKDSNRIKDAEPNDSSFFAMFGISKSLFTSLGALLTAVVPVMLGAGFIGLITYIAKNLKIEDVKDLPVFKWGTERVETRRESISTYQQAQQRSNAIREQLKLSKAALEENPDSEELKKHIKTLEDDLTKIDSLVKEASDMTRVRGEEDKKKELGQRVQKELESTSVNLEAVKKATPAIAPKIMSREDKQSAVSNIDRAIAAQQKILVSDPGNEQVKKQIDILTEQRDRTAADIMAESIMTAETGNAGALTDENRFIRTKVTPNKNLGRHSSAYGPVQMTKTYLQEFKKNNYEALPKEEQEYLDKLIEQGSEMLQNPNDPSLGYGGKGYLGESEKDRHLYSQIAKRSMIDLARRSPNYSSFIKNYRGANDKKYFDKIAKAAEKQGKTPEQLFEELKQMKVEDLPSLPDPDELQIDDVQIDESKLKANLDAGMMTASTMTGMSDTDDLMSRTMNTPAQSKPYDGIRDFGLNREPEFPPDFVNPNDVLAQSLTTPEKTKPTFINPNDAFAYDLTGQMPKATETSTEAKAEPVDARSAGFFGTGETVADRMAAEESWGPDKEWATEAKPVDYKPQGVVPQAALNLEQKMLLAADKPKTADEQFEDEFDKAVAEERKNIALNDIKKNEEAKKAQALKYQQESAKLQQKVAEREKQRAEGKVASDQGKPTGLEPVSWRDEAQPITPTKDRIDLESEMQDALMGGNQEEIGQIQADIDALNKAQPVPTGSSPGANDAWADMATMKPPAQPLPSQPSAGNMIYSTSSATSDAKTAASMPKPAAPVIINGGGGQAPQQPQEISFGGPARNTDSMWQQYVLSRYGLGAPTN